MSGSARPAVVASIPSPSDGAISIAGLSIHAYGLMIALGVIAGVWLTGRRFEQRRVGTRDDMSAIAVWAVIAGVIGARLYHVITDWSTFDGDYARMLQIWRGGLGIPGGLLAGIPVGMWRARRRGIPAAVGVTCAAPALPLSQAIGRWGNWFNQELFGRPTDLPWGLEVSDRTAVDAGHAPGTLFHPTFLYESLWNLLLCGALLWVDRRFRLRPGHLLPIYVIGYGIGRFWVEGLRIDPAKTGGGLRLNQWTALLAIAISVAYLLVSSRRPAKRYVLPDGRELDDRGFAPAPDPGSDLDAGGDADAQSTDGSALDVAEVEADSGRSRDERYRPGDG